MIIACLLSGVLGAVASVLMGLWCGVGLLGLIALYTFGGFMSFGINLAIVLSKQHDSPAASRTA